jgi:outer membrane lipoprotein-sorting protein
MNLCFHQTFSAVVLTLALTGSACFATPADFDKAIAVYQTSGILEMQTEKTLTSPWKQKGETVKGRLYLSKGKFRWEMDGPDREWTIFDGQTLWNVKFASPDFPGKNHVLRMKLSQKEQQKFFYLRLLDLQTLRSDFEISSPVKSSFLLKPKAGGPSDLGFKDITLKISGDHVSELSYKDDLDNQTVIRLQKPEKKSDLFSYKPDPVQDDVEEK